jgi:hypothetical protein
MDTGAECRIHAAEFLAHAKREPEREAHLISMAKSWLRLAINAEQIQALKRGEPDRDKPRDAARGLLAELKSKNATITSRPKLPPLVMANKPRAPVVVLSLAKRIAVIECFNSNGLHKRNGCWCGSPEGKHISGVTVADLARDGMFSVVTNRLHGSARLTERGQWFAGTLIEAANEVQVRE